VWLHRWSHYHFDRGNRLMARFLWHLNLNVTGADVSPLSDLGPGLVIIEPLSCIMLGKSGRNLTVRAHASFGGGMSREDIGAGPGLPLLGDDVELDFGSVILGPLRVGSRTYVGPRCVVHTHIEEDSRVLPPAPRIRKAVETPMEVQTSVQLEVVNG
jgi:serine O-acetyltransferase